MVPCRLPFLRSDAQSSSSASSPPLLRLYRFPTRSGQPYRLRPFGIAGPRCSHHSAQSACSRTRQLGCRAQLNHTADSASRLGGHLVGAREKRRRHFAAERLRPAVTISSGLYGFLAIAVFLDVETYLKSDHFIGASKSITSPAKRQVCPMCVAQSRERRYVVKIEHPARGLA